MKTVPNTFIDKLQPFNTHNFLSSPDDSLQSKFHFLHFLSLPVSCYRSFTENMFGGYSESKLKPRESTFFPFTRRRSSFVVHPQPFILSFRAQNGSA